MKANIKIFMEWIKDKPLMEPNLFKDEDLVMIKNIAEKILEEKTQIEIEKKIDSITSLITQLIEIIEVPKMQKHDPTVGDVKDKLAELFKNSGGQ